MNKDRKKTEETLRMQPGDTQSAPEEDGSASDYPTRRPELKIQPFSSSATNKTHIVCTANGKILEISGALRDMLLLMDGMHTKEQIAVKLSQQYESEIAATDVEQVLERYFLPHDLLEGAQGASPEKKESKPEARGVTLCPANFLFPVTRWLRILFHWPIFVFFLFLIVLCQIIVFNPHWISGDKGPLTPLSSHDYVLGYLLLILSVLFHELGHLSACSFHGCEHGEMRVGLYLIFPVFYSNVTNAWTLPRKARVMVDLGGIYFQMLLCMPALFLYWITGKSLCVYFCMGLLSMALFALNPFLRFDGYWICSDLLGVPNLRARSREVLKHCLSVLFRKRKSGSRTLEIRRAEKVGLIHYAILSHLFLGVFFGYLLWFLPRRLSHLSSSFPAVRDSMAEAIHSADILGVLGALFPVLLPCVLLIAVARMGWYGTRRVFGLFLKGKRRKVRIKRFVSWNDRGE